MDDQISVLPLLRELPCPFHLRNESIYFSLWVLVPLSLEKKIERKCWGGRRWRVKDYLRRTESKDFRNDQHWFYFLEHLDSYLEHRGASKNSKVNHICSKKDIFLDKGYKYYYYWNSTGWHIFWRIQYLRANLALLFCPPWGQHFDNLFKWKLDIFFYEIPLTFCRTEKIICLFQKKIWYRYWSKLWSFYTVYWYPNCQKNCPKNSPQIPK